MPKTVSLLWARDPDMRPHLQAVREQALRTTLDYLEREAGFSRKGFGGPILARADIVTAIFPHAISREGQIHIHDHVLLFNVGIRYDEERSSATLDTTLLYRHRMTASALFQGEVAYGMRKLRYTLERQEGRNWGFEVAGVPKDLLVDNSLRRQQIEAEQEAKGHFSAKAGDIAALATRKPKDDSLTHDDIIANTEKSCDAHGLTLEKAQALHAGRALKNPDRAIDRAARQAIREITDHKAFFTKREVLRKVLEQAPLLDANYAAVDRSVTKTLEKKALEIGLHLGQSHLI